jgi:hypothetical protein
MSKPARDLLTKAQSHLQKVHVAASSPTDFDALYGFYCLEAAVMAAAVGLGWQVQPSHRDKVKAAARLHEQHNLPDVSALLPKLNDARKAAAYGDTPSPRINPDDLANEIENFVEAVNNLMDRLSGARKS